ncbi:MAG TPA: hypothetical protein VJ142_02440 [Candidatus Nanoarchaeia archaeon]|nr:hypothetical protein [Candidatus Nanoarchaeia archaeon]
MAKRRRKEVIKKETKDKEGISKEEEAKAQKKILRNILIGIGILLIGIFLFVIISNSLSRFEYRGVDFEIVRFCDAGPPCLVTYRTSLPVKTDGKNAVISTPSEKNADYNFYFRNDPRKLDVDFNGTLRFADDMVLNADKNFDSLCEENGIAAGNFNLLYRILGTRVIRDENATCDSLGRYVLVEVKSGNMTKIEQFGTACYDIYIKNCEILEGTERFMFETLVKVNEALKE